MLMIESSKDKNSRKLQVKKTTRPIWKSSSTRPVVWVVALDLASLQTIRANRVERRPVASGERKEQDNTALTCKEIMTQPLLRISSETYTTRLPRDWKGQ